jgi:gamma-butyrobetaine dioxygenase
VRAAALPQTLRYGIVFFSGVPTEDKSDAGCELAKLSASMGAIRRTWYGEQTWDVRSVPNSKNIAYTNLDLGGCGRLGVGLMTDSPTGLHMDLVHFEDPPRYQLLHYLHRAPSLTGGLSYFVDSYDAAQRLKEARPDLYEVLCTEKVAFEYNNGGHFRYWERPTIQLDDRGAISAINYSPPFQAPFCLEGRTAKTLDRLLEALQEYARLLDDPAARYDVDMQPGDVVLFDNRRTLHARTAFEWDETAGDEVGRVRTVAG